MDVIIFIGHHKVGTTSLQNFLAVNSRYLKKQGVLYPGVDNQRSPLNRHFIARQVIARLRGEPAYRRLTINAREPHNALAFKMISERWKNEWEIPFHHNIRPVNELFAHIQSQIDRSQPHTVVLCSEAFANFSGVSTELICRLRGEFPGAHFRIFCTLRRVDEYLVSWYGQLLRFGHRLPGFRDGWMDQITDTIHFDYRKLLQGWLEVFPDAEFRVRPYTQVLASGGSVQDFLQLSGIPRGGAVSAVDGLNSSIPPLFYEVCRQANHRLAAADAEVLRQQLSREGLAAAEQYPDQVELFGAELRRELYERFAPIHDFLGQFSPGADFFADQAEMLETVGVSEEAAFPTAVERVRTLAQERRFPDEIRQFLAGL